MYVCVIEISLESHNLVQNIPHQSTNDGHSTQRNILDADSRSTEIPFPVIYLFRYIFFHIKWTSRPAGDADAPIAFGSFLNDPNAWFYA